MKLQKLLNNGLFWIGLGFGVLVLIVILFFINTRYFGSDYAQLVDTSLTQTQVDALEKEFAVQKIVIQDASTGSVLTFLSNGSVTETVNGTVTKRRVFSNQALAELFGKLSLEDFLKLLDGYYSSDRNMIITLQTTHGTKTVVINNDSTNPALPDPIGDLVDEGEEIGETIQDPVPTPPSIQPTTTPSGNPTPAVAPTATPTPTSPPVSNGPTPTPEPFSCDKLDQMGVTVSNTRCLDEEN